MRFRSDPAAIRGSIAPIVTPFTETGEVDHAAIADLVRWQIEAGSHGISIGGSIGEPSAQTVAVSAANRVAVRRRFVRVVSGMRYAASPRSPMVAAAARSWTTRA